MNQLITKQDLAYNQVKMAMRYLGFNNYTVTALNNKRYLLYVGPLFSILVTYKKGVFRKYGEFFRNKPGAGESINLHDLEIAKRRKCKFIMRLAESGNVNIIDIDTFINTGTARKSLDDGKPVITNFISVFMNLMDFKENTDLWKKAMN